MSILVWIVTGIIAGWLAGMIVSGGGYGLVGDLVLGVVGGIIGGWLFTLFGLISPNPGISSIIGQMAVAAAGAIILVLTLRAVRRAA